MRKRDRVLGQSEETLEHPVPARRFAVDGIRIRPDRRSLGRRFGQRAVLPIGCAVFVAANLLFAVERSNPWTVVVVMALAGLGVGCTFAALPGLIVASVPAHETGSAMSFNVVLRYVGYSTGSALSATVLEAHTPAGAVLPTAGGYTTAALIGIGVLALAGVLTAVLPGRPGREPAAELVEESLADAAPLPGRA